MKTTILYSIYYGLAAFKTTQIKWQYKKGVGADSIAVVGSIYKLGHSKQKEEMHYT